MQSQINFTLSFWVNATRIKKNQVSVYGRITVNGKRANISLQRKVFLSGWDSRRGRAKGNKQESRILNRYLDQVKNRVYSAYDELIKKNIYLLSIY